jgi:hypothetical protein
MSRTNTTRPHCIAVSCSAHTIPAGCGYLAARVRCAHPAHPEPKPRQAELPGVQAQFGGEGESESQVTADV